MSDAANAAGSTGAQRRGSGFLRTYILRGDIALAVGIIVILAILLVPMPPPVLDLGLAVSITFAVMVLMVALFIVKPLEFSVFPTVLLVATLMRLSLNLATTRLILSKGHEGTDAAGRIIQTFGNFVMNGNVIVGVIVFSILVLVNFIVITKGSGRIAEVAARFSLDAMPGKQMAIDADLSAGLIDEDQARTRRTVLESESSFFGAMDGASKFVRGDAVAGILITFINIIGGIVIGTLNQGMGMGEAISTYTILTIGDGIVSQVPALIVSVAAGLLVSKAGVEGAAHDTLYKQFTSYPQTLAVASGVLVAMSLLPGTPWYLFLPMALLSGYAAFALSRKKTREKADLARAEVIATQDNSPKDEPISEALALDYLRLELGYGLLPLINDAEGHRLTDQIKALRRQLAGEMGFVMPSVRILDNMQLGSQAYSIRVKEVDAGEGELRLGKFLAMDPRGGQVELPGEATKEPAFGLPATWIDDETRDEAAFRGYTVVDPATVITTHLTEAIRDNMPELLSYAETKKLLDDMPAEHKRLLEDIVPSQISVSSIQRILQTLLGERISIRDLPTILEAVAEVSSGSQSIHAMTEHVRSRLARQICHAYTDPATGHLSIVTMSPDWEMAFAESLIGQGEERQLSMAPTALQNFIQRIREVFDDAAAQGESPVLLTSPIIRPYVRSIVERVRPQTTVMSQSEVHPQVKLKSVGVV